MPTIDRLVLIVGSVLAILVQAAGLALADTHYRSIGTHEGALYASGRASITAGEILVSFQEATLPNPFATGAVGQGDRLVVGDETFYILLRVSPTQVIVQQRAERTHVGETFVIDRAYRSMGDWESDRQGDLVAEARREVGLLYNDGVFRSGVAFEGSRTGRDNFFLLTVAEGQRHDGIGSIGAVLAPQRPGDAIVVSSDYTRVEWLEVREWRGNDAAAIRVRANGVSLSNLLLHDGEGTRTTGVLFEGRGEQAASLANTIVFRVAGAGVLLLGERDASPRLEVANVTVHDCGTRDAGQVTGGVVVAGASLRATIRASNVVAINNRPADFHRYGPDTGTWQDGSSHNVSSDSSAPGPSSMIGKTASELFMGATSDVDNFHIQPDSTLRDTGVVLEGLGTFDVDGEARASSDWDRGADEFRTGLEHDLIFLGSRLWKDGAVVQWTTRQETESTRFVIRASESRDGVFKEVSRPIPGLGASVGAASYFYGFTSSAARGRFYMLDILRADGARESYGPVSLDRPVGDAIFARDPDPKFQGGESVSVIYGVPSATTVRVLQHDAYHVDLELLVGGFSATIDGNGMTAWIREGEDRIRVGPFDLPVFRTWLEGMVPSSVSLEMVRTQNMVSFSSAASLGMGEDDVLPAMNPARIVRTDPQGATQRVLIESAPIKWSPTAGKLTLARRMLLRLIFE